MDWNGGKAQVKEVPAGGGGLQKAHLSKFVVVGT